MNIQKVNTQNQQSFKANLVVKASGKMISPDELKFLVSKAKSIGSDSDAVYIHLHPEYTIPLKNGLREHNVRGYHMDAYGSVGDLKFMKHDLSIESVGLEALKKPVEFISEFLDKVNPVHRAKLKERLEVCKGKLECFNDMNATSVERKAQLLKEVKNEEKMAVRNFEQNVIVQMESQKIEKELNLE